MENLNNRSAIRALVKQLFALAQEWGSAHVQGHFAEADAAVQRYHTIVAELWDLKWDANLDPDQELPDELMPTYYIEYWEQIYRFQHELEHLATQWRKYHPQSSEANTVLQQYHTTLAQFFEFSRGYKGVPLKALLPDEFMPAYYLEYKRS